MLGQVSERGQVVETLWLNKFFFLKSEVAMKKLIIAGLLFLTTGNVLAADGWKGDGTGEILAVQPEIYRTGAEGGYATLVQTSNIVSTDCGGKTWVIRSDIDSDRRLYSTVLAAFTSSHKVKLYQWSCYSIDGKFYPRIGGVVVLK